MQLRLFVRTAAAALTVFAVSFASFPSLPHPASKQPAAGPPPTVNRALKGDRLPVTVPDRLPNEVGSPSGQPLPPHGARIGCDAAFSSLVSPHAPPVGAAPSDGNFSPIERGLASTCAARTATLILFALILSWAYLATNPI